MAVWLSVACGILAVAGIALFVKWRMVVRRSERELLKEFSEILAADTNRLITLSAGSGYLKSLAAELNRQLSCLRAERLRYERGDAELKDTISNIWKICERRSRRSADIWNCWKGKKYRPT